MPKRTPHPWLLSTTAWGKGPGACVLRGSVRPVTNSNHTSQVTTTVEAENKSNRVIEMVTPQDKIASQMFNDYQLYLQGMGM